MINEDGDATSHNYCVKETCSRCSAISTSTSRRQDPHPSRPSETVDTHHSYTSDMAYGETRDAAATKNRMRLFPDPSKPNGFRICLARFASGAAATSLMVSRLTYKSSPIDKQESELLRWSDLAGKSSKTKHCLAQFHAIICSSFTDVDAISMARQTEICLRISWSSGFCCTCGFAMLRARLSRCREKRFQTCREHRTDPSLASE